MSESRMPFFQARPHHVVFDPEQSQSTRDLNQDLSRGIIPLNKAPYSPSDLKAVHNATNINISPASGKKTVNIAITIAYNWPADYIQSCFNAMCRVYSITPKTIEVINLNSIGKKWSS